MLRRSLKLTNTIFLIILVYSLAACTDGHNLTKGSVSQINEIQEILEEYKSELGFPGVTLAFSSDGTISNTQVFAYGYSDVELMERINAQDRMLSGSVGKTYFSALAIQLASEGKLDLDSNIGKYLSHKEWFSRIPNANSITTRMLLNHTSGIPEHVSGEDFIQIVADNPDKVWGHEELLNFTLDKEPLFLAGDGWSYADTNYILMGVILEEITGTSLYDELEKRLLRPLELHDTVPSNSRTIPGLIPGYTRKDSIFKISGKTIIDGKFYINPQLEWTGGGIASTTKDLARWGWLLYNGKAFKPEFMNQLLEGKKTNVENEYYGLGVFIWENDLFGTCFGHSGIFPGYLSSLVYLKDYNLSLAVQFNSSGHGITRQLMLDIIYKAAEVVINNKK